MSFSNLELKKVYYYVICAMAFFVLMWGAVDLMSSSIGLLSFRGTSSSLSRASEESSLPPDKGEQFFDAYYQQKMLYDRLWDSLARVIISGIVFAYSRYTANKLEKLA